MSFVVGKSYYTAHGRKCELLGQTTDGKFIIGELSELDTYEGTQTVWGYPVFVDAIYETPPRELIDAEIAKLLAEAERLRQLNERARREALDAARETTAIFNSLKKYKGLERIQDFIDGKMTHVVIEEYVDRKILTLAEMEQKDDRGRHEGLRLISLLGKSNGDLTWQVNSYRDGSGSWKRIIPCASEADAIEARRAWLAEDLVHARKEYLGKENYLHHLSLIIAAAIQHGVDVPADLRAVHDDFMRDARAKNRAALVSEIGARTAKLATMDAEPTS